LLRLLGFALNARLVVLSLAISGNRGRSGTSALREVRGKKVLDNRVSKLIILFDNVLELACLLVLAAPYLVASLYALLVGGVVKKVRESLVRVNDVTVLSILELTLATRVHTGDPLLLLRSDALEILDVDVHSDSGVNLRTGNLLALLKLEKLGKIGGNINLLHKNVVALIDLLALLLGERGDTLGNVGVLLDYRAEVLNSLVWALALTVKLLKLSKTVLSVSDSASHILLKAILSESTWTGNRWNVRLLRSLLGSSSLGGSLALSGSSLLCSCLGSCHLLYKIMFKAFSINRYFKPKFVHNYFRKFLCEFHKIFYFFILFINT